MYPEYLQDEATVANLALALTELLADSPARARQVQRLQEIAARLATLLPPAEVVAELLSKKYLNVKNKVN